MSERPVFDIEARLNLSRLRRRQRLPIACATAASRTIARYLVASRSGERKRKAQRLGMNDIDEDAVTQHEHHPRVPAPSPSPPRQPSGASAPTADAPLTAPPMQEGMPHDYCRDLSRRTTDLTARTRQDGNDGC